MAISFDLLPVELQASIVALRAAHVDEGTINLLIDRTIHALGVRANRVQVEVLHMEERLAQQLAAIDHKIESDLQARFGATNDMLIDVRNAQQAAHPQIGEALAGIAELKKDFGEMEGWRGRIESAIVGFMEARDLSVDDRAALWRELVGIKERLGVIEHILELAEPT